MKNCFTSLCPAPGNFIKVFSFLFSLLFSVTLLAQVGLWQDANQIGQVAGRSATAQKMPGAYRTLDLNQSAMQDLLWQAPSVKSSASGITVQLPLPEGGFETYVVKQEQVFSETLESQYGSTTRSFSGHKAGDATALIRLTLSPIGFYAAIFKADGGTYYIEPIPNISTLKYMSYFRKDQPPSPMSCLTEEIESVGSKQGGGTKMMSPSALRQYRMVYVGTGEFGVQFGVVPPGSGGTPTIANVQAAIATSINVANGVYKRDVGVSFLNNTPNSLIFLNPATDPYDPSNSLAMLSINQVQVDNAVGTANYDIAHVVAFGNFGGVAAAATCNAAFKAQGYSSFDGSLTQLTIDYFCHESGHQLGANHTFSATSCGTSVPGNRYEPGEGNSILAYANVCAAGDRIQTFSDPFFSCPSINEMNTFISTQATCNTTPVTMGNPEDPTVSTCATVTIPKNTPFALVGSATDATDQATLLYGWEQFDSAPATTAGPPDCMSTTDPMFRFIPPTPTGNRRVFPSTALAGDNDEDWEKLPCAARTMNFRLLVRDNNTNWGRTAKGSTVVTVSNEGPFAVGAPNGGENISNTSTVTWAGASAGLCGNVDILLSTDGGATYPTALATNTPNDGSEMVTFPAGNSTNARIMVQCHTTDGMMLGSCTFFDVSNAVFSYNSTAPAACSITAIATANLSACNNNGTPNNAADDTFTADVSVTFSNPPASGNLVLSGDGSATVPVAGLASPHTFMGVSMSADGSAIDLTATFDMAMPACTFQNANAGTAPAACSMPAAPTISQTDSNGDGNPDIVDPCSCADPQNLPAPGPGVTHFHDFVTIVTGVPGETWRITNITSGQMLTMALAAIPVGTVIPETAPGVYHLDFWHPSGVGFNAEFNRDAMPLAMPLSTGGTCNAATCVAVAVPTMGEWGLIVLALLMMSFGTVFMMRREAALVGAASMSMPSSTGIPFERTIFMRILGFVMLGLALVFAFAMTVFGYEMTSADVPGSLIAGPILAYLVHLLAGFKKA